MSARRFIALSVLLASGAAFGADDFDPTGLNGTALPTSGIPRMAWRFQPFTPPRVQTREIPSFYRGQAATLRITVSEQTGRVTQTGYRVPNDSTEACEQHAQEAAAELEASHARASGKRDGILFFRQHVLTGEGAVLFSGQCDKAPHEYKVVGLHWREE